MIKSELIKLSSAEIHVIFYWRILRFPKILTSKEISDLTNFQEDYIIDTIKKFNKNCRLKLELLKTLDDIKDAVEWHASFYDRNKGITNWNKLKNT